MQIIPVASGKGGVGKSLLSANLAIALGQAGKKVILADLDLGASNLHLVIGQSSPKTGIGTWLADHTEFKDIIAPTDYENVSFIAGDSEVPGLSSLKVQQKNKLIKELSDLDADYVILDLGAGTHQIILDMFLLSPQGIIVTAPTVTATLNAYLFLKNAVFRLMYTTFKSGSKGAQWLEKLKMDSQSLQRLYIPKMIENLRAIDPENAMTFSSRMAQFHPRLSINMIDDPKDIEKAQKIRRSCAQYLGLDIDYLGVMYRDMLQDKALSSRLPVIIYKPQSVLSQAIYRIADKILATEPRQFDQNFDLTIDTDTNYNSFQDVADEAEEDYALKMNSLQDLVGNGTFTTGELSEMIKTMQYELTQIKKENLLLKSKLVKAAKLGFKV
ncbi:MAG: P-loop NTPase [Treponema sp.]|nr:P-loop NTPase [Treponema sp.]